MTRVPFSLVPFPGEPAPPGLSVSGEIVRDGGSLSLRHGILGDLSAVDVAPPAPRPARRGRLWEATCLELFLGERGDPSYVELNLSPAGHWNAWRFDAPRAGMRPEPALRSLPFRVERSPDRLVLAVEIDLSALFPPGRGLEASAAAVVRLDGGRTTHWGLAHAGTRPDFHRRETFLLDLPPGP